MLATAVTVRRQMATLKLTQETHKAGLKSNCQPQDNSMYRAEKKSLQILLSRTQVGPGRKVKQEQEQISRNHVQTFSVCSIHGTTLHNSKIDFLVATKTAIFKSFLESKLVS